MKVGAHFLPESFPVFIQSVQAAERAGYERAWLVDSHMLWEEVWVYMTRALAATERIEVGVAVANPVTRHFTVLASAAATLARLHPGRVILGLGRGDSAVRTLGLKQAATARMASIVPLIRELLTGREVDLAGTPIRIRWATGEERVPIMMAATGPRNLMLAGALADVVMAQVGVRPASVRWAIEHIRAGAEEVGRNPDEVEIAVLCGMWVSDDLREARDKTRWAAACAANHVEDVMRRDPQHGMPEELYRVVLARTQHYDYYAGHLDSSAEHTAYLTEELIDDFALTGPAGRCLGQIRELAALGVSEISVAYMNGELDQMDRVGREIVPELSRHPAQRALGGERRR
jgi:alkanesulfonate monooxygenase SsuD/methylene tetrahydromethanopterin reductase-like flavin-dependent oxidoreductase (luciferase family)